MINQVKIDDIIHFDDDDFQDISRSPHHFQEQLEQDTYIALLAFVAPNSLEQAQNKTTTINFNNQSEICAFPSSSLAKQPENGHCVPAKIVGCIES